MSFSYFRGVYGAKKTSATASGVFLRVDWIVRNKAECWEWLNKRSARIRVSNAGFFEGDESGGRCERRGVGSEPHT